MSDPKRITVGDRLPGIRAADHNAFYDTWRKVAQLPAAPNIAQPASNAGRLVVQIENSGTAIDADFPILKVGAPIFTTDDRNTVIYDGIVLTGSTPDAETTTGQIVIVQGPIGAAAAGPRAAVLVGPTWCRLELPDPEETYTTCGPEDAENTKLIAGGGGIPVLWHGTPGEEETEVWAVVLLGGGAGSTSNVVAYAVVVTEAAAATHGSGGIMAGAVGTCELLNIDGTASGGDALEFKSRHRVPCAVDTIIALDSPHTIEEGTTWPADPDAPESGEAAVWGQLVDPVDYLAELTGFAATKALFTDGAAATDIQWGGDEC